MGKSHEYLTIEETARLLRIGRTHAYELARSGALPGVQRFGRTIRVRRSALLADEPASTPSVPSKDALESPTEHEPGQPSQHEVQAGNAA